MAKLGFIGAGTVGTALAIRLSGVGYLVVAAASRSQSSAQRLADVIPGCRAYNHKQDVADVAELVFITTPDDAIAQVAAEVNWHPGQGVVHCSGAASLDILQPAREAGAQVGSFHPLQTFAGVDQAVDNLPGSTFALEGEGQLLDILKEMASAMEGEWVELKAGDKVLYHTAAVLACNYEVTLVKLATDLWQLFGVSSPRATKALLPLLRGTVNNIATIGLPRCLTGPIARGDLGTIAKHIVALQARAPAVLPIYRQLGLETIPLALGKGSIDEERARELRELLSEGKDEDHA